jgi:siroheme synthase (precorrin-2 oxidase/ferrochelatase)
MKKKVKSVFKQMITPNTWGRKNYQGKSISKRRNHRIDKFRPDELKTMGFVQRIATKYVTGFTKSGNKVKLWSELPNT